MVTCTLRTERRVCFVDVTDEVATAVRIDGLEAGVAVVFVPHTTAGVTINENADPSVRRDLETTLQRLAPPDLPYTHLEGNSDAHLKASLMGSSVTVPVSEGKLQLGTWQGIYFAEFDGPRQRRLMVQLIAARTAS